jgi:hypothetical protein
MWRHDFDRAPQAAVPRHGHTQVAEGTEREQEKPMIPQAVVQTTDGTKVADISTLAAAEKNADERNRRAEQMGITTRYEAKPLVELPEIAA